MPKYFDPMIEKGLYKFKYFFQPNPFKNIKSKNIYNLTPVFYMFISLSCFDNNDDEGFLIFRKQYHLLRRFPGDLFRTELRRFRELGGGVSIWNGSPSKPRYVLIREAQILVLFFRILDLFLG